MKLLSAAARFACLTLAVSATTEKTSTSQTSNEPAVTYTINPEGRFPDGDGPDLSSAATTDENSSGSFESTISPELPSEPLTPSGEEAEQQFMAPVGSDSPVLAPAGPDSPSFAPSGPDSPSFAPSGPDSPSFAQSGPDSPSFAPSGPDSPGGPDTPLLAPVAAASSGRMNNRGWMARLSSTVKYRKFSKIAIPATHDSDVYHTQGGLPFAQNSNKWIRRQPKKVVSDYAITQSKSIYYQLVDGVRMVDLRIMPLLWNRRELWIAHSLYSNTLESAFQGIKKFSEDYGNKEIIVINIHHIYDFQDSEYTKLKDLITKYFGSKAATRTDLNTYQPGKYTLSHLQSTNKPILIFMGRNNLPDECRGGRTTHEENKRNEGRLQHSKIWSDWPYFFKQGFCEHQVGSPGSWSDVCDKNIFGGLDDVYPEVDMYTSRIENALKNEYRRDHGNVLKEYQYIFTPTLKSIVSDMAPVAAFGLLGRKFAKSSLKDASSVIPPAFREWISGFGYDDNLNFVTLDFMTKELADKIIAVNYRRCDAKFYRDGRQNGCISTDSSMRIYDVGRSGGNKKIEDSGSVSVRPGYTLYLYENPGYKGCMKKYHNSGSSWRSYSLPTGCIYNDVDSLRLVKHVSNRGIYFYRHGRELDYVGYHETGSVRDIGRSHLWRIEPATKVSVGPGMWLRIYENPGYRGCTRTYNNCRGRYWMQRNLPRRCIYNDVDAIWAKTC